MIQAFRFFFTLTAIVLATVCLAKDSLKDEQPRKKVAVVLSGGGAKGVAHVGVLKVIERAGIPVDIVTGTSMGSIVGGLYSIGYNANLLDSLVRRQDWTFLLSDKEDTSMQDLQERERQNTYMFTRAIKHGKRDIEDSGVIIGKNLMSLFQQLTIGYNDSVSFDSFPIPFACVATNLVDNSEHDFHGGYLPRAMRASMAIPMVFSPVRLGDKVLIDGGFRNNFPADIAREMGADIIIGVTVQGEPKNAEELGSTVNMLGQIIEFSCTNKYEENLAITDVPIHVDTKGYSAASFTAAAIDTLIRRGEEAAMKHWDELLALKKRIGIDDSFRPKPLKPFSPNATTGHLLIKKLVFENMTENDQRYICRKFHLAEGDSISPQQLDPIMTAMRVDLSYKDAYCRYHPMGDGVRIVLTAGEKKAVDFGIGVRFDNEEYVALQLNGNLPLNTTIPSDLKLTFRLGRRLMARIDYSIHALRALRPRLSYILRHNDLNIYEKGNRKYSFTYNQHTGELSLLNFNIRNLNFNIGGRWDHYHYQDILVENGSKEELDKVKNDHFYSYFARVDYNSENDWHFPNRGSRLHAQYVYWTDNLTRLDGKPGMSDINASWRTAIGSDRFTIQPMVYGRMLFGGNRPYILGNFVGGQWFNHYLEQQMPFTGVGYMEQVDPLLIAAQIRLQQRFGKNNYILLQGAGAQQSDRLREIMRHQTLYGVTLGYYYTTIFGPVGIMTGYANKTKQPYFSFNLGFVF